MRRFQPLGWFLGAGYVPKEVMFMLSSQPSMFTGACGPLRLLHFSRTSAGATYSREEQNILDNAQRVTKIDYASLRALSINYD